MRHSDISSRIFLTENLLRKTAGYYAYHLNGRDSYEKNRKILVYI